jgi:hypothetical protein
MISFLSACHISTLAMAAIKIEARVARSCRLASKDEHYPRFKEAFDYYKDAIAALNKLADDAKVLDRER